MADFAFSAPRFSTFEYPHIANTRSIRLLKIITSLGSEISCRLDVFPLEHAPSYSALSYTWGDPLLSDNAHSHFVIEKVIICNGQGLEITRNLYHCLEQLQHSAKGVYLWVDALCIDQGNSQERNEQVSMMGEIYSTASCVIVWLGIEAEDSSSMIDLMELLSPGLHQLEQEGLFNSFFFHDPNFYRRLKIQPFSPTQLRAMFLFFNRRWFRRVWIVQEVAFARDVRLFCGARESDWRSLSIFNRFLLTDYWLRGLIQADLETDHPSRLWTSLLLPQTIQLLRMMTLNPSIIKTTGVVKVLLGITGSTGEDTTLADNFNFLSLSIRQFEATDPRDVVFGLSSICDKLLVGSHVEHLPKPDYSKTVQDVYVDFTNWLIRSSSNLSLLATVKDKQWRKLPNLPSWVPDFTVSLIEMPLVFTVSGPYSHLSAENGLPIRNLPAIEGRELVLKAKLYDTIAEFGPVLDKLLSLDAFRECIRICSSMNELYPNGQHRTEALWRTLILDTHCGVSPASDSAEIEFQQYLMMRVTASLSSQSPTDEYNGWIQTFTSLQESDMKRLAPGPRCDLSNAVSSGEISNPPKSISGLFRVSEGRKLFRTSNKNLIGLGPESACIGDSVWLIPDLPVPLILRSASEGRFEIVREAYCHGLMHGELSGLDFKASDLEEVRLI